MFDLIFQETDTKFALGFSQMGEILDMIASCLDFDPEKRPTIESLLNCKLF